MTDKPEWEIVNAVLLWSIDSRFGKDSRTVEEIAQWVERIIDSLLEEALQQEREKHEEFKNKVQEILDDHMRRDDRLDFSELDKIYGRLRKLLSQPKEE